MTNFLPTASLESILYRSELLRAIREFFVSRKFIEVQTPVLSADTVVDRYVEPICVSDNSLPMTYRGDRNYYLQTSPEFAMKRLLVAGMKSIYQICPAFRRGDRGRLHNIEFTMLEWYRVGDNYKDGMNFLVELIRAIFDNPVLNCVNKKFPLISFCRFDDLFCQHVGRSFRGLSVGEFREIAELRGVKYPESYCVDGCESDWVDLFFSELVQPKLEGVVVYDYPVMQSQLASCGVDDEGNKVSERFELFLGGVEIANGYYELTDVKEVRKRFEQIAETRSKGGEIKLPVESRLLWAMESESGLPLSSGAALGVDRLQLYLLSAKSIDEVIAFPIEYC
ncbi:MAG: EF-P lysine aminoacylase GenX [Planctomycetaceae bacterium]|jgi:lysyl-tRNA synthetase class 2|nr:EF-P lysine aminoacylase GenX [Planctomycetaceae bacterium]